MTKRIAQRHRAGPEMRCHGMKTPRTSTRKRYVLQQTRRPVINGSFCNLR